MESAENKLLASDSTNKLDYSVNQVKHFEIPIPDDADVTLSHDDKRVTLTADEVWTIVTKLLREVGK